MINRFFINGSLGFLEPLQSFKSLVERTASVLILVHCHMAGAFHFPLLWTLVNLLTLLFLVVVLEELSIDNMNLIRSLGLGKNLISFFIFL